MSNPEQPQNRSTPMPILIALGVVVIVLIVFGVATLTGGDGLTDEARVGRAAVGQNDALQRGSYPDFRKYTCTAQQGTEAEVLARQGQSATAKGARYVDDVNGVAVNGDRATATVVYHFERSAAEKITSAMTFAREGGEWKVCSPGPS